MNYRPSIMASRDQVLQGILAAGVPREAATTATDIALHAASTGLEAMQRVLDSLDGKEWLLAQQVALQVIAPVAEAFSRDLLQRSTEAFGPNEVRHDFRVSVGE